ncbi:MAG TPA: pyrroline-5-carboxylate reductase [Phycisphaerae bacterium]|nr:pyrroline-5-carboxylate reductase [Phycisphaerae bacterium]HPS53528.1 pyrroline-5-carboxylate reductase [Phycisphaerae bacterium]
MNDYKLGVIGGGNMGSAIVGGAVRSGFLAGGEILISEPLDAKRVQLSANLGVTCVDNIPATAGCEKILLAVKPQVMPQIIPIVAANLADDTLIISIAAGLNTKFFDAALNGRGRIVRVMPNTPMLVGEGASAVCSGPRATAADVEWTKKLLTAGGGTVVEVEEKQMDAVTAVSGSGPAYFFYLLEAMIDAGVAEGLSRETATLLAVQTCKGSAVLQNVTGESPEELRRKVTSPGGTTQQAIDVFDAEKTKETMIRAVRAAADKSRLLGR